jgi:hypothetical protein
MAAAVGGVVARGSWLNTDDAAGRGGASTRRSGPLRFICKESRTTANAPVACLFLRDTADLRSPSPMALQELGCGGSLHIDHPGPPRRSAI